MTSSLVAVTRPALLAVVVAFGGMGASVAAPCSRTAPVVTAADLAAIERAVVYLPAVGTKRLVLGVGTLVPRAFETLPVPSAIRKVLPQYAGYRAFRSDMTVAIVDPKQRRIAYLLSLREAARGTPCGK